MTQPNLVSLFTGGMGLDLGFEKAGFRLKYTNDIANYACNTIRKNRPNVPCDNKDLANITSKQILERSGLEKIEVDAVIGGPPCQPFSMIGTRRGFDDKRGIALLEYARIIRDLHPKFFVFENVPGLLSMSNSPKRNKSKKYGPVFAGILNDFNNIIGYKVQWGLLNSADYGVPQKRKRIIIIGSRISDPSIIFKDIASLANFSKFAKTCKPPWKTLWDALSDLENQDEECIKFPKWSKYLKHVPPGGCWVDLPDNIKDEAMRGSISSDTPKSKQGGRMGYYRRLSWDAPSPTLVASPVQFSTCLCHPDKDRPLSVKEYSRIQGFPDDWEFVGTIAQKYRMIGQAVPVALGEVIAKVIKIHLELPHPISCIPNLGKNCQDYLITNYTT